MIFIVLTLKKLNFLIIIFLVCVCTTIILFDFTKVQALEYGHAQDCYKYNVIKYNKLTKRNKEIQEIQNWLKANGYYNGKIDGIYGKKTVRGIKKFQKLNHLKADGIIGYKTWAKIGDYQQVTSSKQINFPHGTSKLLIDLLNKELILIVNNKPYKYFQVAVGKLETPTPIGQWKITRKAENWGDGFGSRWMGLNINWGLYGIHGTNKPWSIGRSESHGCIRMNNHDIENLYKYIKPGDKVSIYGNPFTELKEPLRVLMNGEKGTDVVEIQKQLKRLGFYNDEIDGIFGYKLEKAVKDLQREMKVEVTAQIREKEYKRLGFGEIKEIRERY